MGHAAQPRAGDFDDTSDTADPDDTDTTEAQPEAPSAPTVDVLALPDLPGSEGAVSTDYDRPATYRDCMAGGPNAARPCPWLSCTEHAIHALPTSHPVALALRIHAPTDPGEADPRADRVLAWLGKAPYSCTIDATQEALTLETAGGVYGVTRERVRQMESSALRDLRTRARSPRETAPAEGIRHAPAVGFAQRMESRALLRAMRDDVFSPDAGPATSPPQRNRTAARVANEGTLRDSPPPAMYAGLGHPTAMGAPEDRAWCPTLRAPVTGKLCVSRHTARDRAANLSSDPKGAQLYPTCAKCEWAAGMMARFPAKGPEAPRERHRLPVVYGGVGATGATGGFTAPGIAPPEPRPGCAVEGCNDPTRAEAPGGDTPAYLHGLCVLHTRALAVRRGSTYGVSIPVMALREYLISHGAMGGVSAWWRAKERASANTTDTLDATPPPSTRSTPAPTRAPATTVTRTPDPEPPVPIPPTAFATTLPSAAAPVPTNTPDAATPTGNPECTAIHCNSPAHTAFRGDPQRLKELCKYHIGRAQDVLAKRVGATPQTVLAYLRDNGSTVGIVEHLRACGEIPGLAGDAITRRREAMANARAVKAQRHAATPPRPQGFPGGEPLSGYASPAPSTEAPQPASEAPPAPAKRDPAGTGPAVLKGSLTGRVGPMTLGVTVELDPEAAALLRVGNRMGLARATRLLEGMETLAAINATTPPGAR